MEDEKMKEAWRMKSSSLYEETILSQARSNAIIDFKHKTALNRLSDRYRRFFTVAFIFAPVSLIWTSNPLFDGKLQYPLMIYMFIYFMICGIMDLYLYKKVNEIDILAMPTAKVISLAKSCRKLHIRFIFILLPLAAIFIGLLVSQFIDDKIILLCMLIGGGLGLIIGSVFLINFMQDYKRLS